jgi:hypothetical protein
MAVTSHLYPNALGKWNASSGISPTGDSFVTGLFTGSAATWTSTQWAYVYNSSLVTAYTEVATGGGYTSGYGNRLNLTTFTWAVTGTANIWMWTCTAPSPISFGATTTITAASMWIYDKTANSSSSDSNSWAIVIIDFGGNVVSTAGAFTYTVAATPNGLAYWTCS